MIKNWFVAEFGSPPSLANESVYAVLLIFPFVVNSLAMAARTVVATTVLEPLTFNEPACSTNVLGYERVMKIPS